jgi:hypothetical protein
LVNRYQRRHSNAFSEQLAHAMTGCFGRDHGNIDVGWRLDLSEVNIEAVREHERLAFGHVRRDFLGVQVALDVIGDQNHYEVSRFGGFGYGQDFQARGYGFRNALAAARQPDNHVHAAIAQVERVGVALASVADDRYSFVFQ